jgi:hypothetical protein
VDSSEASNLDDLRDTGPYEILCARCSNRLGYAAAHPFRDEILLGTKLVPKSDRTGGYSDIDGYQRSGGQPISLTLGYPPGSLEWKRQQRRRIVATGDGRFTFHCPKCGAAPVMKMPTLISKYQAAHEDPHRNFMQV